MMRWAIILNMKYFYLTIQYLFQLDKGKRFLTLFLYALPACLVLSAFFPITGYFEWLFGHGSAYANYGELWLSLVQRDTFKLGLLIAVYFLLILSVSAITTTIIRSLRVGKFQVKSLFYIINENFLPSLWMVSATMIGLLVFHSLFGLFLFTWQFIPNVALSYALSMISFLLCLSLLTFVFSKLALWLPIMSINGLRPFRAMESAISKTHQKKKNMFVAFSIAVLLLLAAGTIAFFFRAVGILDFVINVVTYTIMLVYYCALSLLAYFDIEGITREDLAKRPYLRR